MSDFTKIETQEQFDEAIKERIARVEKTTREAVENEFKVKFGDYDDVKKKNTELTEQITKLTDSNKEFEVKLGENTKTIEQLTAQNKANETNSVKMGIALKLGLPYDLATRLTGDTEEEITKDAESLMKIVNKQVAPIRTNEPTNLQGDQKLNAQYKELLSGLNIAKD